MSNGLCECGCGGKTEISKITDSRKGAVRGQPRRFIHGHSGGRDRRGYVVDAETGCWNFAGHINRAGRAGRVRVEVDGKPRFIIAYRYYYELERGPIPDGLVLDHTCRNPRCVNPAHLDPVTQAENLRRADIQHGADGRFETRRES